MLMSIERLRTDITSCILVEISSAYTLKHLLRIILYVSIYASGSYMCGFFLLVNYD